MKTWKVLSIAGLVLTGLAVWHGPVQAQYYGGNIDAREDAQQRRIQDGIRSGAITPQEARRLEAEQQRIQAAEDRMRADGRLDYRERARLGQMQNKADRDISREKHDNQVAYPGTGNRHDPRFRQWQQNQRRDHRQGVESRPQPYRGPHYSPRGNGCDRGAAYRPHPNRNLNPGERGRITRIQNRDRRTAWNR